MQRLWIAPVAAVSLLVVSISLPPNRQIGSKRRAQIHLLLPSGQETTDFFAGLAPNASAKYFLLQQKNGTKKCAVSNGLISRIQDLLGLGAVVHAQDVCYPTACGNNSSHPTQVPCTDSCGRGTYWESAWDPNWCSAVYQPGASGCNYCGCELDSCYQC